MKFINKESSAYQYLQKYLDITNNMLKKWMWFIVRVVLIKYINTKWIERFEMYTAKISRVYEILHQITVNMI